MTKKIVFVLTLAIFIFVSTACVEFTVYPEDGIYVCEKPYIYFENEGRGSISGLVEFEGERLEADIYLLHNGWSVRTSSYDADNYYNSSWKLDKDGNIIITLRESKEEFILIKQDTKKAGTQPLTGSLQ